jgi:chromosome segregation protein
VIFQGSAGRRPVNLTEVSLHLDNSSGDLPIAYQEVVITRRLSRSARANTSSTTCRSGFAIFRICSAAPAWAVTPA